MFLKPRINNQYRKKEKPHNRMCLRKIDDSLKTFMEYQQQADRLFLEAKRERRRERRSKGKRTEVFPEVGKSASGLKSSLYSCVLFGLVQLQTAIILQIVLK